MVAKAAIVVAERAKERTTAKRMAVGIDWDWNTEMRQPVPLVASQSRVEYAPQLKRETSDEKIHLAWFAGNSLGWL
jgi:hypothetical protein